MSIEKGNEKGNNDNSNPNGTSPVGSDSATSGADSEKVYDSSFVEKLKGEKDNFRNANQSLRDELEQMKAEQKAREEAALKEKEDWKTLYEKTKLEKETLEGKLGSAEMLRQNAKKESELKSELAKLGVKPQYVERASKLANLDSVKIDKETGVIYGAEVVAKALSEDWPDLFGPGQSEKVEQQAPGSVAPTGALSLEEWQKLPYEERKKREGEMMVSQGVKLKR